jgi:eukaryotic-like serine/threonine-protein kinase
MVISERYRLESQLGQGAMGAVWAATHVGLGEAVAIKFIDAKYAASPETRQRFETEAKAMAKLRSRFVVSVFDNGRLDDGTLYLVMERLFGETLQAYIKRRGSLSLAESVEYAGHVARALGRAHARGVVHRDVKPSNIFLADTPDDGRIAKVLDFGIAKLSRSFEGIEAEQTGAGVLLGTPQYMSPEQARGQVDVDQRADIYSLGLVFLRMYTGAMPRAPGQIGDIIARILTEPLPKLSDLRPEAPAGLDAWFARTCAFNPADRFESVEACIEMLAAVTGVPGPGARQTDARQPIVVVGGLDGPDSTPTPPPPSSGASSERTLAVASYDSGTGDGGFPAGGSMLTARPSVGGPEAKGLRALRGRTWGGLLAVAVVLSGVTVWRGRAPAGGAWAPSDAATPAAVDVQPAPALPAQGGALLTSLTPENAGPTEASSSEPSSQAVASANPEAVVPAAKPVKARVPRSAPRRGAGSSASDTTIDLGY